VGSPAGPPVATGGQTVNPKRIKHGEAFRYVDMDRPKPDKRNSWEPIPGVTTIVRAGLPKPQFTSYAGTATAEYAVNNWERLSELPPADRLKEISKGRYEKRDAAAGKGKVVHNLAEHLITGVEVPIPDGLEGYVEAATRFMDQFDFQPFDDCIELTVFHPDHYYCGTLDLGGTMLIPDLSEYDWVPRDDDNRASTLIDYKTSASGIWGDIAFQFAGYKFAKYGITRDGETIPLPKFDLCAGVHLRADGTYSVVPVEVGPEQFEDFLAIKRMSGLDSDYQKTLVYPDMVPPLGNRYKLEPVGERF